MRYVFYFAFCLLTFISPNLHAGRHCGGGGGGHGCWHHDDCHDHGCGHYYHCSNHYYYGCGGGWGCGYGWGGPCYSCNINLTPGYYDRPAYYPAYNYDPYYNGGYYVTPNAGVYINVGG